MKLYVWTSAAVWIIVNYNWGGDLHDETFGDYEIEKVNRKSPYIKYI